MNGMDPRLVTPEAFTAQSLALGAGAAFIIGLIGIAIGVLAIMAMWRIFKKAGEPGWKCLIPFYGEYTTFKLSWKGSMYFVYLFLEIIYIACFGYGSLSENNTAVGLRFVSFAFAIAVMVISIMLYHKLSKSFGHGIGFTLGLIFLPYIFILILAFGNSQYIGPEGKGDVTIEVVEVEA